MRCVTQTNTQAKQTTTSTTHFFGFFFFKRRLAPNDTFESECDTNRDDTAPMFSWTEVTTTVEHVLALALLYAVLKLLRAVAMHLVESAPAVMVPPPPAAVQRSAKSTEKPKLAELRRDVLRCYDPATLVSCALLVRLCSCVVVVACGCCSVCRRHVHEVDVCVFLS